jgi:pyruvate dehydrogenase E2 component (dihydrolipoamide acetyltransferase)
MPEAFTVVPLSAMRRSIAARMVQVAQGVPHFRLIRQLEVDSLVELREELSSRGQNVNVSFNVLLIKAVAAALMDVPQVNIQWADAHIHQYAVADIAVVVSVDGGLFTPIVRGAESKSIWTISREVRLLCERAQRRELKMSEIVGGSFSISNLGMYGVDQFDALINSPQCAILAVGAIKPRSVFSAAGSRIANVMTVTLSLDHRAIDGVTGAAFLRALSARIAKPDYMRTEEDC